MFLLHEASTPGSRPSPLVCQPSHQVCAQQCTLELLGLSEAELQGAIHDLVGSASQQLDLGTPARLSARPADEHGLPGPEYEEYMLALEATLLEDLQREQDQLEAEAVDQAAAEELADLVASCSVSCGPLAQRPQLCEQTQPRTQHTVGCPVCLQGQLRRARHHAIVCSSPGCLQQDAPMADNVTPLQDLPHKVALLKRQHSASGCAGVPGFGLTANLDDALFACGDCRMICPLIGGF